MACRQQKNRIISTGRILTTMHPNLTDELYRLTDALKHGRSITPLPRDAMQLVVAFDKAPMRVRGDVEKILAQSRRPADSDAINLRGVAKSKMRDR